MKNLPRAWLAWAGGALIIIVNAIVLGGVWQNRNGEPQRQLSLTERELGLPYERLHDSRDDNNGLALQLKWNIAQNASGTRDPSVDLDRHGRQADWLDVTKLRELGFEPSIDPRTTGDVPRGGRALARGVWFLLEFDGKSYQRELGDAERRVSNLRASVPATTQTKTEKTEIDKAERNLRQMRESESRLFVIDADLDRDVLRQRHPELAHYLVAHGQMRARWTYSEHGDPSEYLGYIDAIDIRRVNVAARWRSVFDTLHTDVMHDGPPRYQVTVAYGSRFEPWIVGAAAMPQSTTTQPSGP